MKTPELAKKASVSPVQVLAKRRSFRPRQAATEVDRGLRPQGLKNYGASACALTNNERGR